VRGTPTNKNKGDIGEELAWNYLLKKDYFLWQRNWKSKLGEIDIIGRTEKTLVFVEVKSRLVNRMPITNESLALENYDTAKHKKILSLVEIFIEAHRVRMRRERVSKIRLDLIAIDFRYRLAPFLKMAPFSKIQNLLHIEDVWESRI
jgi:putative endonuclease